MKMTDDNKKHFFITAVRYIVVYLAIFYGENLYNGSRFSLFIVGMGLVITLGMCESWIKG